MLLTIIVESDIGCELNAVRPQLGAFDAIAVVLVDGTPEAVEDPVSIVVEDIAPHVIVGLLARLVEAFATEAIEELTTICVVKTAAKGVVELGARFVFGVLVVVEVYHLPLFLYI